MGNSTIRDERRILAIASGGGHWIELARLSPALEPFDTLYVTTLPEIVSPTGTRNVRIVTDASRSHPLRLLKLAVELLWLLIRFRPHIIVSTGAAPGLLAIAIGDLFGCRSVWIDSVANADELSMSGRLVKRWATVRMTQWEHLASPSDRLGYIGRVF
jgi:hypothetical protein